MLGSVRDTWPVPDSIARRALAFALTIEHAPMGILMLRNKTADAVEPALGEGLADDLCDLLGAQQAGVGPVGIAFAEHRRVAIRDILKDGSTEPRLRDFAHRAGIRALEVVPLLLEDDLPIGAVVVFFRDPRRPSLRSAMLAERCGRLLAIALENSRLQADAEQRREIIDQLARARIRFVARLSHELRTPLQSIMGYVDLLAVESPGSLTGRQEQILARIRASQHMLVGAIDDLVAVVRIETGRLTYESAEVDASAAIAAAAEVIQPMAVQRGLRLAIAGMPDTGNAPVCVRADDAKVRQVLVNLLANAVRLTRPGGTVKVACRADKSDVMFEIFDGRDEMGSAVVEGQFEQYARLDGEAGSLIGSELGIAISREFAHGMGGALTVRSNRGHGAVATMRLPRALRAGPIRPLASIGRVR